MTATTQTPVARVSTDARATVTNSDDDTGVWWWARTIGSALLFMAAAAVLMALVVIPRLSGATAYTILTGSMEPKYPPGTLVVSKPVDPKTLQGGDVITFNRPDRPEIITHRIAEINYTASGQMQIFTKGDNNNSRDPWVLHPDNVRGKLWYAIPYLGHANTALSGSNKSLLIKLGAGALVLYALYAFGTSARDRVKRQRDGVPTEAVSPSSDTAAAQPITDVSTATQRVLPPQVPAPSYMPTPPLAAMPPRMRAGQQRPPADGRMPNSAAARSVPQDFGVQFHASHYSMGQQPLRQPHPGHRPFSGETYWQSDTEITAPVFRHGPVPQHPVQQFPAAGRHADPNQQRSHVE